MKPKFEKGDRVRIKDTDVTGEIINVARFAGVYLVLLDEVHTSLSFPEHKLEFENPKLAFLTRLQELLATFDATIYDYEQYKLCIDLGDGEQMEWFWGNKPINQSHLAAENVFDYDTD